MKHVLLVSFSDRSNPFHRDPPVAITHRRLYSLYRVADTSDRWPFAYNTCAAVIEKDNLYLQVTILPLNHFSDFWKWRAINQNQINCNHTSREGKVLIRHRFINPL